ncbi:phospholipase/carboxylesterase [Hypoxylon cercidicola]|nr:phospholipase/carboxylesterase [Hypoxylon cercidicola]
MATNIHIAGPHEGHQHTHTVIFLHGKGSDCEEFSSEFFESEASEPAGYPRTLLDLFPTIRWVFPSAPVSESKRFQCDKSQWFDMWSVEHPNERPELQTDGLKQSIQLVLDVVKQEEALVPSKRIFLGGISQGFATAYSAFISNNKPYVGLIGLCSWAPSAALDIIKGAKEDVYNRRDRLVDVFLGHSRDDGTIPVEEGRNLRDILERRTDTVVQFHEYEDGGHWINEPQGVDDLVEFLSNHLYLD